MEEEKQDSKRRRNEHNQWFLVEEDIEQQRTKLKERERLQEEIIKEIHTIQYQHIIAISQLQYSIVVARQREQAAAETEARQSLRTEWAAGLKCLSRSFLWGRRQVDAEMRLRRLIVRQEVERCDIEITMTIERERAMRFLLKLQAVVGLQRLERAGRQHRRMVREIRIERQRTQEIEGREARERRQLGLWGVRERERIAREGLGTEQVEVRDRVEIAAREERDRIRISLEEGRRLEMHQARERVERARAEVVGVGTGKGQTIPPRAGDPLASKPDEGYYSQWEVQYSEPSASPTSGSVVRAQVPWTGEGGFDPRRGHRAFQTARAEEPGRLGMQSCTLSQDRPEAEARGLGARRPGHWGHIDRQIPAAAGIGVQFVQSPGGTGVEWQRARRGRVGGGAHSARPPQDQRRDKRGRQGGTGVEGEGWVEEERGVQLGGGRWGEPPQKRVKVEEDWDPGTGWAQQWEWERQGIG